MIAVGIDPGKNTGVAVWDCKEEKFLLLETMSFWTTFTTVTVDLWPKHEKLLAIVEDPRGNNPVFNRGHKGKRNLKIAQNVGMNKKEAGLLIEGFRRSGIPTRGVVPKQSKINAAQFKQMTGYQGRTNEHKRDAGRLVYKMPEMPDLQYEQMLEQLTTN